MRVNTTTWIACVSLGVLLACSSGDDEDSASAGSSGTSAGSSAGDGDGDGDGDSGAPVGDGDGDSGAPVGGDGDGDADCEVMVNEADCDESFLPFVFVHGTMGAAQDFSYIASLMTSNGYCADRIVGVDYNSLGQNPTAELDALIPALKEKFGVDKVDIGGHSQGTGHASRYVMANPDDFAHYIQMAGGQLTEDPGGVATLCLSSTGDRPVTCDTTANVTFQDTELDHYAVAASVESFVEIFEFLTGEEPQYTDIQCGDPVMIEGRVQSFGDNVPPGGRLEVYEIEDDPRDLGDPVYMTDVPANGYIEPFEGRRGVMYEFRLIPADARAARKHYQTPLLRSDRLIRFLAPSANALFMTASNAASFSEDHSVVVARLRHGAFLHTRDQLLVNGFNALNAMNAALGQTTVGLYMFDDGDMESNGGAPAGFTSPFVKASDVYVPTSPAGFIELEFIDSKRPQFNQKVRIPNWPSLVDGQKDGAIVNFY